jgi:hypothetical protein
LLSAEIRTAANRGLPQPLLSWASRRSKIMTAGPKRNRFPGPYPSCLEKPNSTSPSP